MNLTALTGIRGRWSQRGDSSRGTPVVLCSNPQLRWMAKLAKGKKRIWLLPACRRTQRSWFSHKASLSLNNSKSIRLFNFFIMRGFFLQEYSWTLLEMKALVSIWDYVTSWIASLLFAPCKVKACQERYFIPSWHLTLPTNKWTWRHGSFSSSIFLRGRHMKSLSATLL